MPRTVRLRCSARAERPGSQPRRRPRGDRRRRPRTHVHRVPRSAPQLRRRDRADPAARPRPPRPRPRRSPRGPDRARRARVAPGSPGHLRLQRQRVPRGDARRVQGPGRAGERELPLRRRGAPLPARRQRRPGASCSTPRSRRRWPRCSPTCRGLEVLLQVADDSGNDLLPGAEWYEEALAAASPARPAWADEWSPDDQYILYTGGTTGMPKGVLWRQADIYRTSMGGRNQATGQPWSSVDELVEAAKAATLVVLADGAVHARRRPLDRVPGHEHRRHRRDPGRGRPPRPGRRVHDHRARAGELPPARRRRLRPADRRRDGDGAAGTSRRCSSCCRAGRRCRSG